MLIVLDSRWTWYTGSALEGRSRSGEAALRESLAVAMGETLGLDDVRPPSSSPIDKGARRCRFTTDTRPRGGTDGGRAC